MENIFAKFTGIILGVVSTVSSVVGQPIATPTPTPTPQPSAEVINTSNYSTQEGNYSIAGKNLVYKVQIPNGDGPITGTISGDCKADITGQKQNKTVTGEVSGNCSLGLINPPVKATFSGEINNQQVFVNYQLKSPFSYSGTTNIGL